MCSYIKFLCRISADNNEKREEMGVTLTKFIPSKIGFDDPAIVGFGPGGSPMGGSFEEEIYGRTEEVDELGENRSQ